MKNKVLTLSIVFALIISVFPIQIFAIEIENNKTIKNSKISLRADKINGIDMTVKKPTKAQIRAVGSAFEYYKQIILEEVEFIYSDTIDKEYIKSVKTELDKYYNDFEEEINNTENEKDLIEIEEFGFFEVVTYSEFVQKGLLTLEYFVGLSDDVISSNEDIDDFKEKTISLTEEAFNCYTNDYYNDYNYSIITNAKNELMKETKNINNLESLVKYIINATLVFESIGNNSITFDYQSGMDYYCYIEDSEDSEDYNVDEYMDFVEETMGMKYLPELSIGGIAYSNDELKDFKTYATYYLDLYINKELQARNYTGNITDLKTKVNKVINEINKSYDVNEIIVKYENTYKLIQNTTGVEFRNITTATINSINNKINQLNKKYTNRKVYSDDGINQNMKYIEYATKLLSETSETSKDIEIPNDFIERLEKKLKETLTFAEELKQVREEAMDQLNVYKDNKKYNQTKVKLILKEAQKKVNASEDIEEIWELCNYYVEKLKKTINKYTITTKKVGKGTITKTKTITYGSNFTVKMTPKKGYKIKSVLVDGKKVKKTSKYTFKKVTKKHTIKVTFVKK